MGMKDGEYLWQKEKRCEAAHNKPMCEEWYDKEMKFEEEMWLKEKKCAAVHGEKACQEWYDKELKDREEEQMKIHQKMVEAGAKSKAGEYYHKMHADKVTPTSEENSSTETKEESKIETEEEAAETLREEESP